MRILPTLTALLLIAGAAAAQPAPEQGLVPAQSQQAPMAPAPHMGMKARFEAANTTNDGKLTLEQARAAHLGMVAHNFVQIDTERKGYVTLQDVKVWHQARKQARAGQKQNPAPQAQ